MMRILVVGGTGFLGPAVVQRLAGLGHRVTVYHRGEHEPALPFGVRHVHDARARFPVVEFPEEVTALALDVVLHMTPMGERDSRALVHRFRGVARRVVALSSADVYRAYGVCIGTEAGPPEPVPLTEGSRLREALYPYRGDPKSGELGREYEKILAEREILSEPDLPATVLRLPAVYGPGDPQRRFARFLRRMDDGRSAIVLGRAEARWRWTHGYVENVADAVVLAVTRERAKGRVYNVGESETPTWAERVRRLGIAAGWSGDVIETPEETLPDGLRSPGNLSQDLAVDSGRIRAELDYREPVSVEDGLTRTIAWEREHPVELPPIDYDAEDRLIARLRAGR